MFDRLKQWAHNVKRDVLALYLAARDPRVPWYAKALAALVAAYALSPLDIIPDFIPVLGYLDDLILLPLGIAAVVRLVPDEVMADLRSLAEERILTRPRSMAGAIVVILLWVTAAVLAVWFIMSRR